MYWTRRTLVLLFCLSSLALCPIRASGGPAEDQFDVAAGHYARKRWKLAVDEFDLFLKKFADTSAEQVDKAIFFRGEALVQLGTYPAAREAFLEFLARAPDHPLSKRALFRAAETAYLAHDAPAARESLQRFRTAYPDDELLRYALPYLGQVTLQAGDAKTAQEVFVDALRRFPAGPLADECNFGLGSALQQQGDVDAATPFFTSLANKPSSPQADNAQLQLGIMQYNAGRYDEAAETLARVVSDFPHTRLRGEACYWKAMAHLARQQWQRALAALADAADTVEPELRPDVAFYTAQAYARTGQLDQAVRQYDRVLANWPEHSTADDAALARLDAFLQLGDHTAVKVQADRFDRQFPDSPLGRQVKRIHARALLALGEYSDAVKVLEPVVEAKSQGPDLYLLALARVGVQQYELALSALDRIDDPPGDPELSDAVRVARASALMGLQRYPEAIAPLEAYLKSQPEGPDAADCRADLAVALAATGRLAEAAEAYRDYAAKHGDHPALLATTNFVARAAAADNPALARELFAVLAQDDHPPEFVAQGLAGLARTDVDPDHAAASRESFERLRALHPHDPLVAEAALDRARALRRSNQPDAALAAYRVIIDDYADSDQVAAALWEAARLHVQLGQNRDALPLLERLVRNHPQLSHTDAVLYQWAWLLVDLGRADEADAIFTRLYLEHRPSVYWADATYRLAERAAAQENLPRARQLAEEIVAAQPAGEVAAHSLYLWGQTAARSGDWSQSLVPLQRLCDEHGESPLCPAAEYWLAEANYRLGRYEDAQQRFDELAAKRGDQAGNWPAMIDLRRAQVLAHRKQWDDAARLASQLQQSYPDFQKQYEVDYLLGRCLASLGLFSDARAAYGRVIDSQVGRQTETAAMAQWMIGETFLHQKDYGQAIRSYLRVEILWNYPHWTAASLLQAGKCHEALRQWQPAVETYTELTTKYPQTQFAEEGARRLGSVRQRAALDETPNTHTDILRDRGEI